MFLCPNCKAKLMFPKCPSCDFEAKQINGIWQMSSAPDINTEGEGDKYIGYEHIGESYSGNRKYLMEERDCIFAKEISRITGEGIFLDLACGDGCFTVPCAANGTRIIAGDISNTMLGILQKKAEHNQISLEKVTLCRMNALELPLEDESVDTVVANSVLHLISSPERVISEILRVLKKGVMPVKYSWSFERDAVCDPLFTSKSEFVIERGNIYETPLKDGLLPRLSGRGFSDQINIPEELHRETIKQTIAMMKEKYGEDFADITYKGVEDDLAITVYRK